MRTMVERIVVENGTAVGVEISTGRGATRHTVRVNARHIVSNADLTLTMEKLLGPAVVGAAAMRGLKTLRPSSPCFLVHLGLQDISVSDLEPAAGYHWRSWNADDVVFDAFKIFIPTMYEPKMAPPGGQVIILQRIMQIGYDRVADWAAHKERVEDDLVMRLGAEIPGVSAHITTRQSASALTSWRFTLNLHGAMLGWEMSPDQLGDKRPGIDGLVRNLYMCGHWTRPGGGITPVIVSAMEVAQRITG